MNRLGIYLRVSTEIQASEDRYSIPVQRELGKKFAETEGFDYEIFEDYKSGGSVDRAGWQALFVKVEAGEIDGIWIAKIDRFSRDTSDGLTAIKILRKMRCRFWVNSIEYDIFDPNTELLITMQFAFAAYERTQIRTRTLAGKKKARDEGMRLVIDMMGWDRTVGPDGKRTVKLNPDEAKVVQHIFSEYLSGTSIPDISRKLVDAGYKGKYSGKVYRYPKTGETRAIEDRWQYSTIQQILAHPEYAGLCWDSTYTKLLESKRYNVKLVTREEWDRAQEMLKAKRAKHDPKSGYRIVQRFASGILVCEKCGAKYYPVPFKRKSKTYHYYSHKRLLPEQRTCDNAATLLPQEEVEDFLSLTYLWLFSDTNNLRKIFDTQVKAIVKDKAELERDEGRIGKALEENGRKVSNFLNAIAAGIDLTEIKSEVDKLKLEKAKLETELSKRRHEYAMKTSDHDELLSQFTGENISRFMTAPGEIKRGMLRMVIKSVKVSDKTAYPAHDGSVDKIIKIDTLVGEVIPINLSRLLRHQADDLAQYRAGTKFTIEDILKTRKDWDDYVTNDLNKVGENFLRDWARLGLTIGPATEETQE